MSTSTVLMSAACGALMGSLATYAWCRYFSHPKDPCAPLVNTLATSKLGIILWCVSAGGQHQHLLERRGRRRRREGG
jgi:hypothetical protein